MAGIFVGNPEAGIGCALGRLVMTGSSTGT